MLCEYGCGQEGIYTVTKTGKMCCSPHRNSCPAMIEKNKTSQNNTGFRWSEEKKKEMSITRSGSGNSMYGKKQSSLTKQKIRAAKKGRTYEEMFGEELAKKRKENYSKKMKGREAWNKGIKYSNDLLEKRIYSITQIKEKFPLFARIEKMRYNPNKPGEKEIQVHCKNHNCQNSKEQNGWFIPERYFLFNRARSLERGNDLNYLYCSEQCKEECPLYNKRTEQLIKQDQINAGIIEEPLSYYTYQDYQLFRQEVLQRADNNCEYCHQPATDVHHTRPQKLEPFFSLDPDYGVACCKECHYKYGHEKGTECSTGMLANTICK